MLSGSTDALRGGIPFDVFAAIIMFIAWFNRLFRKTGRPQQYVEEEDDIEIEEEKRDDIRIGDEVEEGIEAEESSNIKEEDMPEDNNEPTHIIQEKTMEEIEVEKEDCTEETSIAEEAIEEALSYKKQTPDSGMEEDEKSAELYESVTHIDRILHSRPSEVETATEWQTERKEMTMKKEAINIHITDEQAVIGSDEIEKVLVGQQWRESDTDIYFERPMYSDCDTSIVIPLRAEESADMTTTAATHEEVGVVEDMIAHTQSSCVEMKIDERTYESISHSFTCPPSSTHFHMAVIFSINVLSSISSSLSSISSSVPSILYSPSSSLISLRVSPLDVPIRPSSSSSVAIRSTDPESVTKSPLVRVLDWGTLLDA